MGAVGYGNSALIHQARNYNPALNLQSSECATPTLFLNYTQYYQL